jgi:two-component system, sensor histidine kinase and response regulator
LRGGRFKTLLACLFLAVAISLGAVSYDYIIRQRAEAREVAREQLEAIADLKLVQINSWREERMSDARFLSRARFVSRDLQRALAGPDSGASRANALHWLNLFKEEGHYESILVFDSTMNRRFAIPEEAVEPSQFMGEWFEHALNTREPVMSDLHQDERSSLVHLDILVPVFGGDAAADGELIAALLLKVDARRFLFPLVQWWPTPSRTAETLLVRQEGDAVLFLNDIRFKKEAAMTLRLPLNSPDLPAARVLRGETTVLEGVDYQGVPVVAVGRRVPGTDWAIVSKVDQREIYAPMRQRARSTALVLGALLLAATLLVALIWRQREAHFLRRELSLAERVALLMRYANDTILLFSTDGRVIEANECAVRSYGYGLEEIKRKTLRDLRAPERWNQLEQDLTRVKEQGALAFETVHRRKDDTRFPVEVRSSKVSIGGENFILSIVRDITERKSKDEQLRLQAAALRSAANAIVITDRQGQIQWVNAAFESLTGYQASEVIGQTPRVLKSGLQDAAFYSELWKTILAGKVWRGELRNKRKNSSIYCEEMTITPVTDDSGITHFIAIKQDITRRREADAALRQAHENLERIVAERTAQLLEANSNLQTFAHTVAHDLRSPLRSIISFAGIVLEEYTARLDEDGLSHLHRVVKAADRMDRLLNDLLEYTKVSQAEMKLENVSLRKIVHESLAMIDADIKTKKADLKVGPLPHSVMAHPATLALIISNFVSNAVKFVPEGERPRVIIRSETHEDRVRLVVEDNGIGLDPENMSKLFGVFERLHGTSDYAGTGLGLAIARKGAERMGGTVGASSVPGKGSHFWVELKNSPG